MNLQTYIQRDKGNATALSTFLSVPLSYLSQMASGNRSVSPERALAIERFTGGVVPRQELRPKDFWLIWPDLAHLAPDIEATPAVATEPLADPTALRTGAIRRHTPRREHDLQDDVGRRESLPLPDPCIASQTGEAALQRGA